MTFPESVAVTSANSLVGRELLARLAATDLETVGLVRAAADLPAGTVMITD